MPGYVRREGLGPEDAIAAIRAAGGLPVLAHFREAPTRPDLLRELVDDGLGGPGGLLPLVRRRRRSTAVGEVAPRARPLATGGTDYHGDLGPYAEAHARLWVPPEVGERAASTGALA